MTLREDGARLCLALRAVDRHTALVGMRPLPSQGGTVTSKLSGKTRGAIAGTALLVGVVTGGLWSTGGEPATSPAPAASSCTVFAGRSGSLPCQGTTSPEDAAIRKAVGTTFTGCLVGLLSGGFAGAAYGCLGGAASLIPWG